jgi:hypothetical protein
LGCAKLEGLDISKCIFMQRKEEARAKMRGRQRTAILMGQVYRPYDRESLLALNRPAPIEEHDIQVRRNTLQDAETEYWTDLVEGELAHAQSLAMLKEYNDRRHQAEPRYIAPPTYAGEPKRARTIPPGAGYASPWPQQGPRQQQQQGPAGQENGVNNSNVQQQGGQQQQPGPAGQGNVVNDNNNVPQQGGAQSNNTPGVIVTKASAPDAEAWKFPLFRLTGVAAPTEPVKVSLTSAAIFDPVLRRNALERMLRDAAGQFTPDEIQSAGYNAIVWCQANLLLSGSGRKRLLSFPGYPAGDIEWTMRRNVYEVALGIVLKDARDPDSVTAEDSSRLEKVVAAYDAVIPP